MSSTREFVQNALLTYSSLASVHGGRVFQGQAMREVPTVKPFLTHKWGNDTDENLTEDPNVTPHRQFFSVWIYDDIGDYVQIDNTITEVKKALSVLCNDKATGIITIRFLEASQDLLDEVYNAIFRYVRFQMIMES